MILIVHVTIMWLFFATSNCSKFTWQWPPSKEDCTRICCQSSAVKPSNCPDENLPYPGKVFCLEGKCLVRHIGYDRKRVPHETRAFNRPKLKDDSDPCPAEELQFNETEPLTPLVVDVELEIKDVSNISPKDQSFDVNLAVRLKWFDKMLFLCHCAKSGGRKADRDGMAMVYPDVETKIWIPDLSLWEFRTFERKKDWSNNKLNKIHVKEVMRDGEERSVHVHFKFRLETKLTCAFVLKHYPFDVNICKIQIGSYSYNEEVIAFNMSKDVKVKKLLQSPNFDIKVLHLTGTDARIPYQGDIYQYTGFRLRIERKSDNIVYKFQAAMIVSFVLAVISLLHSVVDKDGNLIHDRTGLLSSALISGVLTFRFAIERSEEGRLNSVVIYVLISNIFIMMAFMEYFLLVASFRMFPSVWGRISNGRKYCLATQIDLSVCFILTVGYALFYYWFWDFGKSQMEVSGCANV